VDSGGVNTAATAKPTQPDVNVDDVMAADEESKAFYKSRTVIVNVLGIAFAAYEMYTGQTINGSTALVITGVVNILLRSFGGLPLSLTSKVKK